MYLFPHLFLLRFLVADNCERVAALFCLVWLIVLPVSLPKIAVGWMMSWTLNYEIKYVSPCRAEVAAPHTRYTGLLTITHTLWDICFNVNC